jgi:16S rRNA processing protein RimM
MSDDLTTWNVVVGRVSGRWDKASLKVQPFSETPGRFAAGARLCAVSGNQRQLLNVKSARQSGHSWILDCGLSTQAAAEALHGAQLFIHPSMRPALPPGEFYLDELLGLRVRTEAGEDLGEIEEVLETPAHDIYVTPLAMIPGHADFVVETDFENKVLVVRDIPGLKTNAV